MTIDGAGNDMSSGPARLPDALPVLPLPDTVLFPMELVPVHIRRQGAIRLVEEAMEAERLLAMVGRRNGEGELGSVADLATVGTSAVIHRMNRDDDGSVRILVQGIERIRLLDYVRSEPYLVARVHRLPEQVEPDHELEAIARAVRELFLNLAGARELPTPLSRAITDLTADPVHLAYLVAANVPLDRTERQAILETDPVRVKLRRLLDHLQHERSVRDLEASIASKTREELSKSQREYVLREQLKTIQRELGETDAEEADELRERVRQARLPPDAEREAARELARLERLPAVSPEHAVIRTYLDWLVSLPWGRFTARPVDIAEARRILDRDHYDLEKVKERILEHLAVKRLREERGVATGGDEASREPILCFVGPPGVGKTSLGRSIASASGRQFIRISLGGIHDESEIRGHRRTYVGALPGRILQTIRRGGAADPVFMLDEVDKLGSGFHGDPSAALLEVLDPAQNRSFEDHYLDVAFDLSRVLFLCTANTTEPIPPALLDRMEILPLAGYAEEEKLQIARRYLLPKLLAAHGLREDEIRFEDDAIRAIVAEYTREAGVRNLEREMAKVLRRIARRFTESGPSPATIDGAQARELLGPPTFRHDLAEQFDRPGVALALAWTPAGGEVLFVEAAMMKAERERLVLTGMMGEVMRESAQSALSYLRANGERFGIPPDRFQGRTVHLHVPAGSVHKDGPSAGVAMLTALASVAGGRRARGDVAMSGEVTLRGKVLPVGGIKEKVLAAFRAGVRTVLLPRANEGALEEIPDDVRASLRIEIVDSVEQALALALEAPPEIERIEAPPSVH